MPRGERRPSQRQALEYGQGTILLVDDEEIIIETGQEMLKRMGYRVLIARSGKEALSIYKENREVIDLIILDMIMPGMGGGETFGGLEAIDEQVKVLLSSGYSIDGQATEILKRGCIGFIQKPFSVSELSMKVKEAMEG
jgi:DNA-binding NtrC family response regulator